MPIRRRIACTALALALVVTLAETTAKPVQPESSNLTTISIEYIAHACFVITTPEGERLLIDPFASRVWLGYDYPAGIEADAVLITHPHYDHDGGISVDRPPPWSAETPVWREPGTYTLGDTQIVGIAGKHADPYGKEFGQTNTIWVVDVAGLRIAHLGDNGPISDAAAAAIAAVDILFLPADADFHIVREHEVQPIFEQLTPRVVIPMHYRHADLEPGNGPAGLRGIEGWLQGRPGVRWLGSNELKIAKENLNADREILVFEHSPLMKKPARQDR